MKLATKLKLAIALGLIAAVPVAAQIDRQQVLAHDGENHETAQAEAKPEEKPADTVVYSYVAQPGDSYTLIARKAVQTYGRKFDIRLTEAEIVYAETNLTREAGSPELNVGQKVSVDESKVKKWVEQTENLTKTDEAAWAEYAQFADFNTDNVGESK